MKEHDLNNKYKHPRRTIRSSMPIRTHRFLSDSTEILSNLTRELSDSYRIPGFRISVGDCGWKLITSDVLGPNIDQSS